MISPPPFKLKKIIILTIERERERERMVDRGETNKNKRKNYPRLETGIVLPPDDTEIQLLVENPKRGKSAVRYERYKIARTFSEYYALGGSKGDAKFDLARGYITIIKEGVGITYDRRPKKRKTTSSRSSRKAPPLINSFSIYMRQKKKDILKRGGDYAEKSKYLASLGKRWKMLPPEVRAKYEKMAEEENRKQRSIMEEQRKQKARKLGLPSDATWEMIDAHNSSSFSSSNSSKVRDQKKRLEKGSHVASVWGQNGHKVHQRIKAVRRGVDFIFNLVNGKLNIDGSNDKDRLFRDHGADAIQCFNDIACASGEPIKRMALMYSEQLTDRFKHYVDEMGWKIEKEPTPAEVVDAIASVYALESTSVTHAYKAEIVRFCVHLSSYCASDYFGWDVRGSPPPSNGVPELCMKCGSCSVAQNTRGSFNENSSPICSKCNENLSLLTRQRALCNALVYLYYANRVGVKLGADFKDALKWLPEVRPYKGPHQLDWNEYVDQCYLVTHVVFTVSEWGALRLDKELLPHEYYFLREHMISQIRVKNVRFFFSSCFLLFLYHMSQTLGTSCG